MNKILKGDAYIMRGCNELIIFNTAKKLKMHQLHRTGTIKLDFTRFIKIGGKEIRVILIELSSGLKMYKKGFKRLELYFDKFEFVDKLTYIMLECIIYDLYITYDIITEIIYNAIDYNIQTCGVSTSILSDLLDEKIDYNGYVKKFSKVYEECHFRKIVNGNVADDSTDLCNMMSEIKTFLKFYDVNEFYRNQISEMICELADNAREHTKADCLIDIDVTTDYQKNGYEDEKFCALNIAIVNFSSKCLGYSLQEKILNSKYNQAERYEKVNQAYNLHSELFCKDYRREDFFNIASFQDSITGRFYDTASGGTGLTALIKSLEENSDTHYGYVLSGYRGINFVLDYLKFNEDNWIGFNKENDFINKIPSKEVILQSPTYIPGTAYNFTLIVKMGG